MFARLHRRAKMFARLHVGEGKLLAGLRRGQAKLFAEDKPSYLLDITENKPSCWTLQRTGHAAGLHGAVGCSGLTDEALLQRLHGQSSTRSGAKGANTNWQYFGVFGTTQDPAIHCNWRPKACSFLSLTWPKIWVVDWQRDVWLIYSIPELTLSTEMSQHTQALPCGRFGSINGWVGHPGLGCSGILFENTACCTPLMRCVAKPSKGQSKEGT